MKELPLDSNAAARRIVIDTRIIAANEVDDKGIHFCLEYWNACRGSAFAPRWRDFHLDELPPALAPYVLVLDVAYEPLTYTYRFWGTGHTRYHQRDYTGKTISAMTEDWSAKLLMDQYDKVLEARKPLAFVNTYDGVETPLKSLRMPLSDDGETITHMFSYVGRGNVNEAMKGLFSQD